MAHGLNPGVSAYEGIWTDWTKGSVWGHTLTLNPTKATILTSSLAIFVTLCGIQLWTIIRYILHQWGVSLQPQPLTPHLSKQQLILRNASSALETARLMLELAWTAKTSTGKRSSRAYIISLSATVFAVLFLAAGAFSGQAISGASANGASAVLLRSDHCGLWNETYRNVVETRNLSSTEDFSLFNKHTAMRAHDVRLSLEYARICYMSETPTIDMANTCHTFKEPTVGWTAPRVGSCPFASQICHNLSDTIVLDTGDIDSHEDLGINAPQNDRLRYRRVTTCAVLNDTSRVRGWNGLVANSSSPNPVPEAAYAYYGPSVDQNTAWTYSYTNFASFYNNFSYKVTTPYHLDVEQAFAPSDPEIGSSGFVPIPELAQKNADVVLFFLSFTGMYLGKVEDPWFAAHKEHDFSNRNTFLQKRYARDAAISTIGCTETHKFCTSNDTCTDFLGFIQVQNDAQFNTALTPHQNATFNRMLRAVVASRLLNVVGFLPNSPLLANNLTISGKSGAVLSQVLPDNQWKLEIQYWHAYSMAQLQRTIVQWASSQIVSDPQWLVPATEEQDVWFCDSLIVPSASYQSFSVVAIVLLLVFGALIIVTSIFIEELGTSIRKWLGRPGSWKHWDYDNMFEQGMKWVDDQRKRHSRNRATSIATREQNSALTPCPAHWQTRINLSQGMMLHIPTKTDCQFCARSPDNYGSFPEKF
ncbi:hypothetical protein H2198_009400 [Neophaeococcomyces mojaviensis]|uniref:Uncharacterized protein n=1 Tax=Neophaeococcomyces mojaviensis TaxID=3383035 RepID=A0ACC2ZUK4_9EURO|nr:hypothetical protein H2198_009400 [Knufia sp. JES_112]